MEEERHICSITSPIGELYITTGIKGLERVSFTKPPLLHDGTDEAKKIAKTTIKQLNDYFSNQRKTFELPLNPNGTEFQQNVWQELQKIPFGHTSSYQSIANALNNPKAVRAVGLANGANPIAIIIPCHRIIGSDGSLTGYAAGIARKTFLLNLEQPDKQLSLF